MVQNQHGRLGGVHYTLGLNLISFWIVFCVEVSFSTFLVFCPAKIAIKMSSLFRLVIGENNNRNGKWRPFHNYLHAQKKLRVYDVKRYNIMETYNCKKKYVMIDSKSIRPVSEVKQCKLSGKTLVISSIMKICLFTCRYLPFLMWRIRMAIQDCKNNNDTKLKYFSKCSYFFWLFSRIYIPTERGFLSKVDGYYFVLSDTLR